MENPTTIGNKKKRESIIRSRVKSAGKLYDIEINELSSSLIHEEDKVDDPIQKERLVLRSKVTKLGISFGLSVVFTMIVYILINKF